MIRRMNIHSYLSVPCCRCDMILSVSKLEKSFHLYQQNNAHISVLSGASFDVAAGECVALTGPVGMRQVITDADDLWQLPRWRRTNPDRGHRSGHGDTTRSDGRPTICGRLCQPVPARIAPHSNDQGRLNLSSGPVARKPRQRSVPANCWLAFASRKICGRCPR